MRGVIDTSLTQLNTQVVELQSDEWFWAPGNPNSGFTSVVGTLVFNKEYSPTVWWSLKSPGGKTIISFYPKDVRWVTLLAEPRPARVGRVGRDVATICVSKAYDVIGVNSKCAVIPDLRQHEGHNVCLYLSHQDDRPRWAEFVGQGELCWYVPGDCWELWVDQPNQENKIFLAAFRPNDVLSAIGTVGGDTVEVNVSKLARYVDDRGVHLVGKRQPKSGHLEYTDPSQFKNQRVKLSVHHPGFDNYVGEGILYWDEPTQTWDVWEEAKPGSPNKSCLVGAFRASDVKVIEYVTREAKAHIYVHQLLSPSWS